MKRKTLSRQARSGLLVFSLLLFGSGAGAEVAPSTRPPGGLAPSDTPQIVLLTFDDSVTTGSFALVQQALTNRFNANGHPIKATFFVSLDSNYDPAAIRKLYEAGHEIAIHTMSHATGTNSSLARWRQEIAGERRTLSELCALPESDIVGFRSPFLRPNDNTYRALSERLFLYDSSFPERLEGYSTATTNLLWPYTLDHGVAQVVPPERAPATNYPGLFEIPLWEQFTGTVAVATMDPPESLSSNEVVALWQTNFLSHYNGNRAPYGIFLHATSSDQWLSNPTQSVWRVGALRAFIGWALARPDTWFISCGDLAAYMLAPVPASAAATNPAFLTPVRTPYPTSAVSRCSYPQSHTFSVCGECPPAAPAYTNAYLGFVPLAGGALSLSVISQNTTYAWCSMVVSNNVADRIYDWSVGFTLTGGSVQSLFDATWTQTSNQVDAVARQYNRQIAPGASRLITFRVLRNGEAVTFSDAFMEASGLGPQPIRLDIQPFSAPGVCRLTWDDNAYLYRVESSTNLLDPSAWTTVTNELCQPVLVEPTAGDAASRFFRVQGTIY